MMVDVFWDVCDPMIAATRVEACGPLLPQALQCCMHLCEHSPA